MLFADTLSRATHTAQSARPTNMIVYCASHPPFTPPSTPNRSFIPSFSSTISLSPRAVSPGTVFHCNDSDTSQPGRWVRRKVVAGISVSKHPAPQSQRSPVEVDDRGEVEQKKKTSVQPVVILPGLGNNSKDYTSLVFSLEDKAIPTVVAQVSRPDWLRNAAGLLDGNYWAGKLQPRPILDWYLERIKTAITTAKAFAQGGWLARLYMSEFGADDISLLLTLGTPHIPPPKGVPGVFDQTRGLLDYIEAVCPGTFFAPKVRYVCIVGRYLKGERFFPVVTPEVSTMGLITIDTKVGTATEHVDREADNGTLDLKMKPIAPSLKFRLLGQAYKQVCGKADVWGDGIVPEISAHLEGAINVILKGVYHSPVGANNFERPWYGSPGILEQWVHYVLE
eukprot:c21933_g1_i2 orf=183-1364(+)